MIVLQIAFLCLFNRNLVNLFFSLASSKFRFGQLAAWKEFVRKVTSDWSLKYRRAVSAKRKNFVSLVKVSSIRQLRISGGVRGLVTGITCWEEFREEVPLVDLILLVKAFRKIAIDCQWQRIRTWIVKQRETFSWIFDETVNWLNSCCASLKKSFVYSTRDEWTTAIGGTFQASSNNPGFEQKSGLGYVHQRSKIYSGTMKYSRS